MFENIILPTHASCHVQFVMFQVCSFDLVSVTTFIFNVFKVVVFDLFLFFLSQEFANSLLDVCWEKVIVSMTVKKREL